jgi:hypothetical protein
MSGRGDGLWSVQPYRPRTGLREPPARVTPKGCADIGGLYFQIECIPVDTDLWDLTPCDGSPRLLQRRPRAGRHQRAVRARYR